VRTKVTRGWPWRTIKKTPRARHGVKGRGNTCCGVVN